MAARAFASLSDLFKIMEQVSRETSLVGYFLKGSEFSQEIEEALKKDWLFSYEAIPSITCKGSRIVKVWNVSREENG